MAPWRDLSSSRNQTDRSHLQQGIVILQSYFKMLWLRFYLSRAFNYSRSSRQFLVCGPREPQPSKLLLVGKNGECFYAFIKDELTELKADGV